MLNKHFSIGLLLVAIGGSSSPVPGVTDVKSPPIKYYSNHCYIWKTLNFTYIKETGEIVDITTDNYKDSKSCNATGTGAKRRSLSELARDNAHS